MKFLGVFLLHLLAFGGGLAAFHLPQAHGAGAASIFVGPAAGTFTVGSTFTVSIYINTAGQSVNALEANLSFPPDKLQVVSPTAGKSIIQVWVAQPTYSNSDGTLKFQGAIPTPGINTESGLISTVTFRVKSVGTAAVRVLSTSRVLLNDGKGTDVLGQTGGGIYALTLPPPAGPLVTSPTNPDQEKWHNSRNVVLNWETQSDIRGFSYVLNESPVDDPDDISEGARTSLRYSDLADGISYFHIKALRGGVWGGITSYAIKIDGAPPAAFAVGISPGSRTSNRRPIISFETTDAVSGIDHYELKLIPLDPSPAGSENSKKRDTPFFIEAASPYSEQLELGRYDVVVRAYDRAGNFYQATERLTVTSPIFEFIRGGGLRLGGAYVVSWPYVWIFVFIVLIIFGYAAIVTWKLHRRIERHLDSGAMNHPDIQEKLRTLDEKQKEYGAGRKLTAILAFIIAAGAALLSFSSARAAENRLAVEPPVVTLFPKSLSNDEIFYIGGRAGAPNAEVIVYLQNTGDGSTLSYNTPTDSTGAWFYSLPSFLGAGNYVAWTQLKVGEELSPPSSKLELAVQPTALQIGAKRLSFERMYFLAALILAIVLLGLVVFILYHSHHARRKNRRLLRELKAIDETMRRGFSALRRDIESELELVHKAKLNKELSLEERMREEKLLRDLESIDNYIGKEFWEINREL